MACGRATKTRGKALRELGANFLIVFILFTKSVPPKMTDGLVYCTNVLMQVNILHCIIFESYVFLFFVLDGQ